MLLSEPLSPRRRKFDRGDRFDGQSYLYLAPWHSYARVRLTQATVTRTRLDRTLDSSTAACIIHDEPHADLVGVKAYSRINQNSRCLPV